MWAEGGKGGITLGTRDGAAVQVVQQVQHRRAPRPAHLCAPSASRRPAAIAASARCTPTPAQEWWAEGHSGRGWWQQSPADAGCRAGGSSTHYSSGTRLPSLLQPLALTVLSQPAEARRRTGWPGALEPTSEPLGAAGDQEMAVAPMGCAPSICRRRQAAAGGRGPGWLAGRWPAAALSPARLRRGTCREGPPSAPHLVRKPGAVWLVCQHGQGTVRGGGRQRQPQLVRRPAQRVDRRRVQRRLVHLHGAAPSQN